MSYLSKIGKRNAAQRSITIEESAVDIQEIFAEQMDINWFNTIKIALF